MRLALLFIGFFLISIDVSAQDIITLKRDGVEVKVKIESIDDELIHYKKFDQKKRTTFSIPISEVTKVVFESGEEKIFNSTLSESTDQAEAEVEEPSTIVQDSVHFENDVQTDNELEKKEAPNTYKSEKSDKQAFKMKLGLGGMIGLNMTTIKYAYNNEATDIGNSYRLGLAGGLTLEWEIWRMFSLYTAFYYKDKGDQINGESYVADWQFPTDNPIVYTAEGSGYIKKHLGYLEWSFLPLFGYTNRTNTLQVQFGGGVYAAYGLSGKEKIDMSITYYRNGEFDETEVIQKENPVVFSLEQVIGEKSTEVNYYNVFDYGLIAYLGVKPRPFNINVQLAYGMANISSISIEELFTSGENIKTASNLSLTLAVGYVF